MPGVFIFEKKIIILSPITNIRGNIKDISANDQYLTISASKEYAVDIHEIKQMKRFISKRVPLDSHKIIIWLLISTKQEYFKNITQEIAVVSEHKMADQIATFSNKNSSLVEDFKLFITQYNQLNVKKHKRED